MREMIDVTDVLVQAGMRGIDGWVYIDQDSRLYGFKVLCHDIPDASYSVGAKWAFSHEAEAALVADLKHMIGWRSIDPDAVIKSHCKGEPND